MKYRLQKKPSYPSGKRYKSQEHVNMLDFVSPELNVICVSDERPLILHLYYLRRLKY